MFLTWKVFRKSWKGLQWLHCWERKGFEKGMNSLSYDLFNVLCAWNDWENWKYIIWIWDIFRRILNSEHFAPYHNLKEKASELFELQMESLTCRFW